MDTFERVIYRVRGRVVTATLRNPTETVWTLSGNRVDGHGRDIVSNHNEVHLFINLEHGIVSRTPMRMNETGSQLETVGLAT